MQIIERNIQQIGHSFLITLPKDWATMLKLKKGASLKMIISDQGSLSIAPEFTKNTEEKHATFPYDANFERSFIREYFNGTTKITITYPEKTNTKPIHTLLKHFLNTQIIEETDTRIIIKCFRIEDLTIQECFKRMFYLTLNLIEHMNTLHPNEQTEIHDTITRFYYMMIMQIRVYLNEGRFITDQHISLLRAMDYRMAGERLQRIAQLTTTFTREKNQSELDKFISSLRNNLTKAGHLFLANDYEKARTLWKQFHTERDTITAMKTRTYKNKEIILYQNLHTLESIFTSIKDITMFIR